MTLLGFFEEGFFRGYPQIALAASISFWPAALVLSAAFGALHYFMKPFETWVDALSVGFLGFFLSLTLRRTGSLWFAVGFHGAFEYAALVLFAAPNSGMEGHGLMDHLLRTDFHGSDWLTGGPLGPEASLFVFPVVGALFWAFHRLYPGAQPLPAAPPPTS